MKILVAVDLEAECTPLLNLATAWATRLSASIDLVYVDELEQRWAYVRDTALHDQLLGYWSDAQVAYRTQLKLLLNNIPNELRGQPLVIPGHPAEAVTQLAVEYDVLVVGTHGRKGVQRLWLGSVAEKIVRLSTVPVLVLPGAQG